MQLTEEFLALSGMSAPKMKRDYYYKSSHRFRWSPYMTLCSNNNTNAASCPLKRSYFTVNVTEDSNNTQYK